LSLAASHAGRDTASMRFIPVLCMTLLSSCASVKQHDAAGRPPVGFGEEFTLALGDSIGVAGKQVILEFEQVLEDSRCPVNVRCVWEGNAKIALAIKEFSPRAGGGSSLEVLSSTVELNTSSRFATKQKVSDFTVELLRVEPTPVAGAQTRHYVITLIAGIPQ
jgi:hypothetical protein